jgi:hypothetical protein
MQAARSNSTMLSTQTPQPGFLLVQANASISFRPEGRARHASRRSKCRGEERREVTSFLQQGSRGALCIAGGAKLAAVQSVEDAFRGKEAVSASILCNNTRGSALNFNDATGAAEDDCSARAAPGSDFQRSPDRW